MRIFILTLLTTFTLNAPVFANHEAGHNHADMSEADASTATTSIADANTTAIAQINGLVCDFCAQALEKVFSKRDEVVGINVNLDTKLVTIGFKKDATIDDETITQLITDAGYNVVKIER